MEDGRIDGNDRIAKIVYLGKSMAEEVNWLRE